MFRIEKYPGVSGKGMRVDSHAKAFTFFKEIILSQVLVFFYEFSYTIKIAALQAAFSSPCGGLQPSTIGPFRPCLILQRSALQPAGEATHPCSGRTQKEKEKARVYTPRLGA